MRFMFSVFLSLLCLVGCNSYRVTPLPYDANLKEVYLIDNPDVIVFGFKKQLMKEFNKRGIAVVQVSSRAKVPSDKYSVSYVARQSWDCTTYLSEADIEILKENFLMADGEYEHIGRSFSLDVFTKWRGLEYKMAPLYNELLKNYK